MSIRICTWNSQGNPANNFNKSEILVWLYRQNDVLLIQECGDIIGQIAEILDHPYCYYVPQAGAFNNRCSTCIITKQPADSGPDYFYLSSGSGRYAIHIFIFGVHIYTLHSLSGNGTSDVIDVLNKSNDPFIIGGDMNCTPEELKESYGRKKSRMIQTGTQSRPMKTARFIRSNVCTHPSSRRELDYFLVNQYIHSCNTKCFHLHGGDHYAICTTVY